MVFRVDQRVYAPLFRYPNGSSAPYALTRGIVRAVHPKSCDVEINGYGTQRISTSLLHTDVGVCIVRVGDFRTERAALDPICKSLLQFLRLLLPDDQIKSVSLRTQFELEELFRVEASAYTLWIFVGHATEGGELCFVGNDRCASRKLSVSLAPHAAAPRTFLFLSCYAGLSGFAKPFSLEQRLCNRLIGPTGLLHAAAATQFAQTFLSYLFLEGRRIKVAFDKAARQIPMATRFRLWRNGEF